ncbi:hypothetical protein ANO14919_120940 [Xylariales sp. No.14919]|nr:hypothetical protein ANO14919_120940 [Xylariales sp. No.14919]
MDLGDHIYRAAKACSERFDACVASPELREHIIFIRSAQGDYNLWCSAIKATSRGKASLDYRLRNHQDVSEVVCGLLAGLETSLGRWMRRATDILGDTALPVDTLEEGPHSPSSTDSPASWDAISDERSNADSAQDQDAPSMDPVMAECMSYVKTTLDQLARVSLAIRKAGNKYRFEKADAELDADAFTDFRKHLASIILRAFPDPEAQGLSAEEKMKRVSDYEVLTPVQKRLVHANILRKHRIEFVTKSRKKGERPPSGDTGLVRDPRRLDETRAPTTSSSAAGSQNSSQVQGPALSRPPVPDAPKAAPTPSVVLTEAPTATDVASRLNVKHLLSAQTPSKVTNLTRVGSKQAYPKCPKLGLDGLLICPYCDDVLPSSYAKMEQSWKAHVIQDLMPYSCFISECETPYEMYPTTENLLAHVMSKHSSVCWTCSLCRSGDQATGCSLTHTLQDFWSAEAWESHVKKVHSDRIKVSQLSVLAELSKRSVVGPLTCPLCDFSTDTVDSKIDDHILQHLHEFSLRALPESANPIADEGSKASQVSGSLSHVKDVGHEGQHALEYPITSQTQWSADLERLWALYPISSLQSLMNRVSSGPAIDFTDSATAEFWGFHLLKVSNILEIIAPSSGGPENIDITHEIITNIIDQTAISIVDSLDWFRKSSPLTHVEDRSSSLKTALALPDMPFTAREEIQDEVEFHLFEQRSILDLDSGHQPKHQPRVVLTGGSGVGKTAIAARLAHQITEERPSCSVFWIDASDTQSILSAYHSIWIAAGKLGNVASMGTSLVYYLNWVYDGEWVIILDGISSQTLFYLQLQGWLPSGLRGRLLLTTQDVSCLSLLGQATEVLVPPEEQELPFPVTPALPPAKLEDIDVAIICSTLGEYDAIRSLFCRLYPLNFSKADDESSRTSGNLLNSTRYCAVGHIYGCNAVLALGFEAGNIAAEIRSNFKGIQLALLVGTCSGSPRAADDESKPLFRGDVVIGNEGFHYGLSGPDPLAIIPPNKNVRPLLDIMESNDGLERVQKNTAYFLKKLQASSTIGYYAYPGIAEDKLFEMGYLHKHHGSPKCLCENDPNDSYRVCSEAPFLSCDDLGCDNRLLVRREMAQRGKQAGSHDGNKAPEPSLHYGRIAFISGPPNLRIREDIFFGSITPLACVMSGPEAVKNLPCVVIQGVLDYAAVSHNGAMWTGFAAATAASAAKAILGEYSCLSPWMVPFDEECHFFGRKEILAQILSKIPPGISKDGREPITGLGLEENEKARVVLQATHPLRPQLTAVVGPEGIGKTQVVLQAAQLFRSQHPDCSVFWISARSSDDLNDGFRGIGRRLRVSRISEDNLQPGEDIIYRVRLELDRSSAGKWLLIIDDIDHDFPSIMANLAWRPSKPNGSVLFISRHHTHVRLLGVFDEDIITVPTMNGEEAAEMFFTYLRETQLVSKEIMIDLLDQLRYSPLEITRVCAALFASGMSVIEPLQRDLVNSKNATTQPEEGEEQPETDQPGQADYRKAKQQPVLTGEKLTTVAPLSDDVEDEAKEGVWGYLLPTRKDHGRDPVIVLRKRVVLPGDGIEEASPSDKGKDTDQKPEGKRLKTFQSKPSPPGGFLIGRHRDCDLIVDDLTISNRHCLLFPQNRGEEVVALIQDFSSNGTFVNEAIVGRNYQRELKDYDEIAVLDRERFVFRYPVTRRTGKSFFQQYTILKKIGKGHFAEVFLCVEMSTSLQYAVKVFTKRPGIEDRSKMEGLQQEIALLLGLSHPNIVSLKDTFNERNAVYLVLDLVPDRELFDLIVKKQKLTEPETRKIFLQLFEAVKYLHDRNVVHRDIKPENIVLSDQDWNLKLLDFGLSKVVGDEDFTTTLCGTPSYVAPEVLSDGEGRKYTKAVDIWSLGVVLYICLCGFPPFSDELYSNDFPYTLSQQIKEGRFNYPSPYWDPVGDPALDLIDSMLVVDPVKRFTVGQCMAHPWMTESYSGVLPTPSRRGSRAEGHEALRRGMARERTLLSTINDLDLKDVFDGFDQTSPPQKEKGTEVLGPSMVEEPEELQDPK